MFKAVVVAYVVGGITFIPLVVLLLIVYTAYTSVPVPPPPRKVVDPPRILEDLKLKVYLTVRRTPQSTIPTDSSYSFRSLLSSPNPQKPKEQFWLVLKGRTLYLYEDEACVECNDVINLSSWQVTIWPSPGLLEGELFSKRNAIQLSKEDEQPFYIFFTSPLQMEEVYHALLHASSPPVAQSIETVFNPAHLSEFISTLDFTPDPLPTRWTNALIARLFFAYYRTTSLEQFILFRINKKLSKIKRPAWLTELRVPKVDVGVTPPMISKPMLKNLTKEGEAAVELGFHYNGEFRITVEATATFSLPTLTTGATARTYAVKMVLAVVLKSLTGNLLLLIKPPPSNRIWYAFTSAPTVQMSVEPVVSDRQIKWNLVLSTIESKLREVILESVVLPNMDDIPFFNTAEGHLAHRGGIWGDAARGAPADALPSVTHPNIPSSDSTSSLPEVAADDSESLAPGSSSEVLTASATSNDSGTTARRRSWFGGARRGSVGDAASLAASMASSGENEERGRKTSSASSTMGSSDRGHATEVARSSRATSAPPVAADVITDESPPSHSPDRDNRLPSEASTLEPSTARPRTISSSSPGAPGVDITGTSFPSSSSSTSSSPPSRRERSTSVSSTGSRAVFSSPESKRSRGRDESDMDDSEDHSDIDKTTASNTLTNQSGTTGGTFLSSLRSRNIKVDKELLSTQAKEALKKWNTGWNARKKDGISSSFFGRGSGGKPTAGSDGSDTRHAEDPFLDESNHPHPANFEEIRERVKERERTTSTTAAPPPLPPRTSSLTPNSSRPIDIPKSQEATRSEDGSSVAGSKESHDLGSAKQRLSAHSRTMSSSSSTHSIPSPPQPPSLTSPPRTTTAISPPRPDISPAQAASTSSAPLPRIVVNGNSPNAAKSTIPLPGSSSPELPNPPSVPIHRTQPSASQIPRMTIPGIHASHKGEVMAIASPPAPEPVANHLNQEGNHNHNLVGGISSGVWKAFASRSSVNAGTNSSATSSNGSAKPTPPPLPARKQSTASSGSTISNTPPAIPARPSPAAGSPSSSLLTSPSQTPIADDLPEARSQDNSKGSTSDLNLAASRASEVLKQLQQRDEVRRPAQDQPDLGTSQANGAPRIEETVPLVAEPEPTYTEAKS
ncbi:hypothetical protein SISNIDRAFT_460524 [Sistotremastrum niveocremeum HHB9708]|uniref:SMP-LTD domain-containing protein n=1 Tax=Sistotremastrum niveocremeum HHB9708 TaxID=1314777 RepID=A0A164NJJ4_9AGAM|nr:hypothetical protein SISNIDRAFT_460524 [Sistotremastrum niveocremeum HHB9708]